MPNAAPIPVADLLIEPGQFPARYPAVVLDATAVYRALQDIDGVACRLGGEPAAVRAPPRAPQDTAAVQGIDSQDASSLIVTVTRPATPLRDRAEQLDGVPVVHRWSAARTHPRSRVTVLPAPPVDADDSYAVDQTVTAESSGSMRRTLTLAAQVGDVRGQRHLATRGDAGSHARRRPDTQALDTLFTDAVLKVRRIGGPWFVPSREFIPRRRAGGARCGRIRRCRLRG